MAIELIDDRRGAERLEVQATATIYIDGVEIGEYAVDNLSADGALLSGGDRAPRGESCEVLLQLDHCPSIALDGHVVRSTVRDTIAVSFDHDSGITEDAIRSALYGAIPDNDHEPWPELWDVDDPDLVVIVPPPR